MSARPLVYRLAPELDPGELRARLLEVLEARVDDGAALVSSATGPVTRTYLDTFDWRLFRAGGVLELLENGVERRLRWRALGTAEALLEAPVSAAVRFARDLPPGRLRRRLARRAGLRALLPVATTAGSLGTTRVTDELGAPVFAFEVFEPRAGAPAHRELQLIPGRDGGATLRRVRRLIERELGLVSVALDPLLSLTARAARPPGEGARLPVSGLHPAMRSDAACKAVLIRLVETMRENEPGLKADLDSEFLHDYRVAVRRTRTLLGRMRGVFPPRRIERFRAEFAWLGEVTGPARDLDVYLLSLDAQAAVLPGRRRDDLEPLRGHLRARKRGAHARLVAALDSPRYAKLFDEWERLLHAPVPRRPRAPHADRPIGEVLRHCIRRTHRRVIREGRAIGPESPSTALHELRKTCKKLRYLLELFAPLLAERQVTRVVKRLKGLQQVLGEFQDHEVQGAALRTCEAEMSAEGALDLPTAVAIEMLVDELARRQAAARARVERRFRAFAAGKSRARLARALDALRVGSGPG